MGRKTPAPTQRFFGIYVMPQAKEGFGSALGRSFNVKLHRQTQIQKPIFQRMKLFCGSKEIQAHPSRPRSYNRVCAKSGGQDGRFHLQGARISSPQTR